MLPKHVITEIDKHFSIAGERSAAISAAPTPVLPPWLTSIGTVISTLLPSIIQVLQALQTLASAPTAAQFFAKGHELFCGDSGGTLSPPTSS